MKRSALIIGLALLLSLLAAVPVSQQVVFQTAEAWLETESGQECTIDDYEVIPDSSGVALIYKIDFDPDGFVIIAADDSSYPILAYSESGTYETSNPAMNKHLIELKTL